MGKFQPFTKRDYDKLQEARRKIHDLLPMFDRAQNCGIDCDELRQAAEELRNRLESIEREFMTPSPSR